MPISKEQLSQIIAGKARDLCQADAARTSQRARSQISEGARMASAGGPRVEDYDYDADKWDAMVFGGEPTSSVRPSSAGIAPTYSNSAVASSRLPDAIKESMMNTRIDVNDPSSRSVLDTMGIQIPEKKQITEQQYQQQYYPQQNGVDYTIIKAIVSECINEYFSKRPLNENALSQIMLQGGNISLVDNKGNIFRAKLEKIGNRNDK